MQWQLKHQLLPHETCENIINCLIEDRHLTFPEDPLTIPPAKAGLDPKALKKAIERINFAIKSEQPIIIYGDYDADGITATAILWESLHYLGAKVIPFIPSRELHGYGLSLKGLTAALLPFQPLSINNQPLVITVDNGITAFEAATYLAEKGIDLIITDHHQKAETLPSHVELVHSDQISGAGVAWFLAKAILEDPGSVSRLRRDPGSVISSTLDLVTIGTIADMMPLTGVNRSLVKAGLVALRQTKRPGLLALYKLANLEETTEITPYHVNFIIAPRLNAMGRLEHALDSLRLLCTKTATKAEVLAAKLSQTNTTRQDLTQTLMDQALSLVTDSQSAILIIDHPDFHEGVIGLVAGKLVEKYYRPTIIISRHEEISKASARSVKGVNIIELIRRHETLLINAGGHPMAAGFTLKTDQIEAFRTQIKKTALEIIDPSLLKPSLSIDYELPQDFITMELFTSLQTLKPFGIGNPEPVFSVKDIRVVDSRIVGKTQNHLKLVLQTKKGQLLHAIGFNLAKDPGSQQHSGSGEKRERLASPGVEVLSLAFTLSENTWNGKTSLQLLIKDIK